MTTTNEELKLATEKFKLATEKFLKEKVVEFQLTPVGDIFLTASLEAVKKMKNFIPKGYVRPSYHPLPKCKTREEYREARANRIENVTLKTFLFNVNDVELPR